YGRPSCSTPRPGRTPGSGGSRHLLPGRLADYAEAVFAGYVRVLVVQGLDRQPLCDRAGTEGTSSTAPELRMGRAGVFFRARPKLIEKVHRLSSCLVLPAEGASDGRGVLGMVRHRFVALEGGKLGLARLPAAGP